ncbi:TPA: alpha-glucan family phosphorylase [Candidatus Woesearchaeota archaeon]|nr:alpha-glucan family phosphorylase [Candidatus Woesearchaeota archaeon]
MEDRNARIAYFSMELGLSKQMPTYCGGLGLLAGDLLYSAADLNLPIVGVTLLYKKGHFYQKINAGEQQELPVHWSHDDFLMRLPQKIAVTIEGRSVAVQAWGFTIKGNADVPVIFLDTDLPENSAEDRTITHTLYGGDERYRIMQEAVLGIGGVRMLNALGFESLSLYHMNEGHSALLALELLSRGGSGEVSEAAVEAVKKRCIFTTHTPAPSGHDKFEYTLVFNIIGEIVPKKMLMRLGGEDRLNMTLLALNLSHYVNGVAKKHGEVSSRMFPGYHIESITNGVNSKRWTSEAFKHLFDRRLPHWQDDPLQLRKAAHLPDEEVLAAHREAKSRLIDYANEKANAGFDYDFFTIGFARRFTGYKRPTLILNNIERLKGIANSLGPIQLVFAGKAHPKDAEGKALIRRVYEVIKSSDDRLRICYLENYDMETAMLMTSGVDLWLNNPKPPQEASGTSGMKAAHNGVPSLSTLDGWWIEGCIEGVTGWAIEGSTGSACSSSVPGSESERRDKEGRSDKNDPDMEEAESIYLKLEKMIMPTFYNNNAAWVKIMKSCISINASFFNSQRMVKQYVVNAYNTCLGR